MHMSQHDVVRVGVSPVTVDAPQSHRLGLAVWVVLVLVAADAPDALGRRLLRGLLGEINRRATVPRDERHAIDE
jgi:hypothetical protein